MTATQTAAPTANRIRLGEFARPHADLREQTKKKWGHLLKK